MQDTSAEILSAGHDPAVKGERDQTLCQMFRDNELVWLAEEAFNPVENTWRVDLVRLIKDGRWMRKRYQYDVQTRVVYFFGEEPVSDEQLSSLRRSGTLLWKYGKMMTA